jgi:hypothetical protein
MGRTRRGGRSHNYYRSLLCVLSTIVCVFNWTLFGSLVRHHNNLYSIVAEQQQQQHQQQHEQQALQEQQQHQHQHQHEQQALQQQRLQLSAFEAHARGELRSTSTNHAATTSGESNGSINDSINDNGNTANDRFPTGECAINLYGLPRSFKHHVLPSLITHVISVNNKYRCDYFVHFFNVTTEQSETSTRGGNAGGTLHSDDIYLLKDAVVVAAHQTTTAEKASSKSGSSSSSNRQHPIVVDFVSDTDEEFASERKEYIEEIVFGTGGDQASNPYFVKEASFTSGTLLNILKMWHSQDRVWNLMEQQQQQQQQILENSSSSSSNSNKRYKRVAMLRLDVIYTTPIDVYNVPTDVVPDDYNDAYLKRLRKPQKFQKAVTYFHDFGTASEQQQQQHCVVPGFKSFPVNDRYFAGPYEAVRIWAKDRFSRARKHVMEVLPKLESQRLQAEAVAKPKDDTGAVWGPTQFTDFGLHDERFVAYTILPAIRESNANISIRVDIDLWFVRVRADGSIWLKDKPGFGRVSKKVLEKALGRKCTGKAYEVPDPILKDKTPGKWQIKCPPNVEK